MGSADAEVAARQPASPKDPATPAEFQEIAVRCQHAIGKLLPNALYVHASALESLDPLLQQYEQSARQWLRSQPPFTIVKFQLDQPKISYLFYSNFDSDPHPALQMSRQVDLATQEATDRNYQDTDNPPVLHRKETFVTPAYPLYAVFAELTRQEEQLGLLDNPRSSGTHHHWQQRLTEHHIELQGHSLACPYSRHAPSPTPKIDRHKAALIRTSLSKPVRIALEAGLFTPGCSFFDYGCGHGGDIQHIATQGFASSGWDPYYYPDTACISADVVNLGYVINVIEDPTERREALLKAWALTQKVLVVAAQVLIEDRFRGMVAYGDGVITRRNTFQKNYEQEELQGYINQILGVDAIPIALAGLIY